MKKRKWPQITLFAEYNRYISVYLFEEHNFDKSPDNVYATALSARYSVTSW